jgi:hypothetical protein
VSLDRVQQFSARPGALVRVGRAGLGRLVVAAFQGSIQPLLLHHRLSLGPLGSGALKPALAPLGWLPAPQPCPSGHHRPDDPAEDHRHDHHRDHEADLAGELPGQQPEHKQRERQAEEGEAPPSFASTIQGPHATALSG